MHFHCRLMIDALHFEIARKDSLSFFKKKDKKERDQGCLSKI